MGIGVLKRVLHSILCNASVWLCIVLLLGVALNLLSCMVGGLSFCVCVHVWFAICICVWCWLFFLGGGRKMRPTCHALESRRVFAMDVPALKEFGLMCL